MATHATFDLSGLSLTLVASFLACLAEKAEARGVTDEEFRRIVTENGDGLADKIVDLLADSRKTVNGYPVTVDYRQSLKAMIQVGRYDWVNSDITEKHFPITPGPKDVSIELVHFDRVMSSDDVLAELDCRGLRPATLAELLAFGAKYPEKQREFPVVALASVWRCSGGFRRVPFLWSDAGERSLGLGWLAFWWSALCRFAAVRK
jgi:hypothetical protein